MPFQGPVNLKNPDTTFQFIEYYGLDPNFAPKEPTRTFFGRVVCKCILIFSNYSNLLYNI